MLWRLWLGIVCAVSMGFALNLEPVSKNIAEVKGKILTFEANGLRVAMRMRDLLILKISHKNISPHHKLHQQKMIR